LRKPHEIWLPPDSCAEPKKSKKVETRFVEGLEVLPDQLGTGWPAGGIGNKSTASTAERRRDARDAPGLRFRLAFTGEHRPCCEVCQKHQVVAIEEKKAALFADDIEGRRIIFSIGSQRLAIDWFSRITNLPPRAISQLPC
jgi:hypothetical protein